MLIQNVRRKLKHRIFKTASTDDRLICTEIKTTNNIQFDRVSELVDFRHSLNFSEICLHMICLHIRVPIISCVRCSVAKIFFAKISLKCNLTTKYTSIGYL